MVPEFLHHSSHIFYLAFFIQKIGSHGRFDAQAL